MWLDILMIGIKTHTSTQYKNCSINNIQPLEHEPEITDVFGSRFCSDTIYDDRISLFMDYPKRGKNRKKGN